MVDAVEDPDAVEEEDEVCDCLRHDPPKVLAEIGELLGEGTEEGPELEDEFEGQDADDYGADDDGEEEEDGHEGVAAWDGEGLDEALDAGDEFDGLCGCVACACCVCAAEDGG